MSEAEVVNYMRQICEAVKHMHEKNIIHLGKISLRFESHYYLIALNYVSIYFHLLIVSLI